MPIENMELMVPALKVKKDFPALKPGMYQVQVQDIKEILKAPFGAPPTAEATVPFLTFEFTVLNEGDNRGRRLWKDAKPVSPMPALPGKKDSLMWQIVSAIARHPLSKAEGLGYNAEKINALIGQQLQLVVGQKPPKANGKVYNTILSFMEADADLAAYTAEEAEIMREKYKALETTEPDVDPINVADIPF